MYKFIVYAFIALQHNIEITVYSTLAVLQYLSVSWTDSIYMPVAVFADLDLDFHLNKTLPGSSWVHVPSFVWIGTDIWPTIRNTHTRNAKVISGP